MKTRRMVRLPTYLHEEIRRLSALNCRTHSAEVVYAVDSVLRSVSMDRLKDAMAPRAPKIVKAMIPFNEETQELIFDRSQALGWTQARLIVVAIYIYVTNETRKEHRQWQEEPTSRKVLEAV